MVTILGVDPGSYHLGLGALAVAGDKITPIVATTLNPPRQFELLDRLAWLVEELSPFFNELGKCEVVIENIFSAQNPKSAFVLGTVRGLIIGESLRRKLAVHEYSPAEIKMSVTGSGRADKGQVQKMVTLILGKAKKFDPSPDTYDALAIALCHAQNRNLKEKLKCLDI